ncbi:MAG: hypothetical protein KKE62_10940 [Proteobacteria bacterium]|nr:hypothetical protein [Pseudomonadota bacterium]MBU1389120.1 hypothetical protein [Pseudomonadota bacterium]MBU1543344.1 hypothetical protein [Pseudomonadota bacterium]MBU2429915.1 hypothetical protein [Pseudomonadota bacterium]MBU2481330.1 hypothetical protein [Pseudomonadota bacterium]
MGCLCGVVFFAACGYRFEGGGFVNQNLKRVAVKPLENVSSETGAGVAFTNALIREILMKTQTRVVDESAADAVFQGQIKSITFSTLSRTTAETVNERRVQAVVSLKLVDRNGKVLWSVTDFMANEDYAINSNQITDESNKRLAVNKIADRVAEKIVSKTQIDF